MQQIFVNHTASISELKRSPTDILNRAGGEPIAILNHNTPTAYLVPRVLFEKLLDFADDYYLSKEAERIKASNEKIIVVNNIDEF